MPTHPTREQIEALAAADSGEPFVMLNLLRFKEQADGVGEGMSGRDCYARYGAEAQPFLERVGGRLLYAVSAEQSVIGPDPAEWDMVLLVEYPSRAKFLEMATAADYLEIHAYREAALADSRLVACSPGPA